MKKLINAPGRRRPRGAAGHGGRPRRPDPGVTTSPTSIVRADAPVQGKVGIISGGGSGHEPMHGGFVGRGMLDAACPGEVFTSPTPDQMLEATKAVDGGAGVLHIVKNYTGDVLNFEMAADLAKGEGIEVEAVVTNDDVAVQDSLYTAGRRGVGITVIAEKICGAAAEEGKSLAEVAERLPQGQRPGPHAWAWRSPPARRRAPASRASTSADDEMEIGIGIHGEPGPLPRAARPGEPGRRAPRDRDRRGPPVRVGRQRARVRQRHGRHAADRALHRLPRAEQVPVESAGSRSTRHLIGNYITSLEMAGCSITLLKLDDELTRLWDAPVDTPGAAVGRVTCRRRYATGSGASPT